MGDTVIYVPFLAVGLLGPLKPAVWGILAIAGAVAIAAYWPVVTLSMLLCARGVPGFSFTQFVSYGALLGGFTLYGLWGFWYVCRQYRRLAVW